MIYHLYDNHRQHLGMSTSLEELQSSALQAFQQNDIPYAYIRWTDAAGAAQELRVTSASIAASRRPVPRTPPPPPNYSVEDPTDGKPQLTAQQRANLMTSVAIFFFLLYLASEIAAIVLKEPVSQAVFGL